MKILIKILTYLFLVLCVAFVRGQDARFELTQWRFTCPDPADTNFTVSGGATVPGCIHTDLLAHKLISDPFYGANEQDLQWISESECTYTVDFWKQDLPQKRNLELVLKGVTGYAEIFLNGEPLPHLDGDNIVDNAYRHWTFPLDGKVRVYNVLEVRFTPNGRVIAQRKSRVDHTLPDERAWLRTPPYQAGWDWGPALTTYGITGDVFIHCKSECVLRDLNIQQAAIADKSAQLLLHLWTECSKKQSVDLIYLIDNQIVDIKNGVVLGGSEGVECYENRISVANPQLWWPNGSGGQKLYEVAIVVNGKHRSDTIRRRIGLRDIELRQEKDSIGQSFAFIVNGRPTFMKGVNWIPADFFPQNMTPERYRDLLQACKDANMNMIRIWGGGLYEPDVFYDLCDEMGLLVWQDFMYSCALYPGDNDFKENAEKEAVEQIVRLRNHPSLAVWCGNNEVKNGWEDWGWQAGYTPAQRVRLDRDLHYLFDTLLARAVSDFGHRTPYISTSPTWGWGHPECCTEGDSHYWGVWWGEQPFEVWYEKTGRFMSEFGFQSYPDMSTLSTVIPENERFLESRSMKNHQKHGRGIAIIDKAMLQYFYRPDNLEDYIYVSQLVQAYGVGMALEEHRRRMPTCMGTLFWQLNDCWPVASWSCIDYFGRRKALYYEAKRDFEPIKIVCDTLRRDTLPIYLVNDLSEAVTGKVIMEVLDFDGNLIQSDATALFSTKGGTSSFMHNYVVPNHLDSNKRKSAYLRIRFLNDSSELKNEKVCFFNYPGQLALEKSEVLIRRLGNREWEISSPTLQYGVELQANKDGFFSDNFFVLQPGERKTVKWNAADSANSEPITINVRSLNQLR